MRLNGRTQVGGLLVGWLVLAGCPGTGGKGDTDSGRTATGPDMNVSEFTCAGIDPDTGDSRPLEDASCDVLSFSALDGAPDQAAYVGWSFSDNIETSEPVSVRESWDRFAPTLADGTVTATSTFYGSDGAEISSNSFDISVFEFGEPPGGPVPPPVIYAQIYSRSGCTTGQLKIRQIGTCYSPGSNLSVTYPKLVNGGNEDTTVSTPTSGTAIMAQNVPGLQVGWELTLPAPGVGQLRVTKIYPDLSTSSLCQEDFDCTTSLTPKEVKLVPCP